MKNGGKYRFFCKYQRPFNSARLYIVDWPAVAERNMMLDMGRKYFAVDYVEGLIKTLAYYKVNNFHMHLTEWNAFRLNSPEFPGLAASDGSYSQADIEAIKAVAEHYHLSLIPEIDMPGRLVTLTNYYRDVYAPAHPGLSTTITYSCPSMASMTIGGVPYAGWTLRVTNPTSRDPNHLDTNTVAFAEKVITTFMPWFSSENAKYPHQGRFFHIGTDEYQKNADMLACPELVQACYTIV